MKSPRCTKAEKELRLATVIEWLCAGVPSRKMCANVREKWGLSACQVRRYLASARERLAGEQAHDRAANLALCVARLEMTFDMARRQGNVRMMICSTEAQARLLGLYEPTAQRVEICGGVSSAILDVPEKNQIAPSNT